MKNIILIISITTALVIWSSRQGIAQPDLISTNTLQCSINNTSTTVTCGHYTAEEHHGVDKYRKEIQRRFEDNPWLKWDMNAGEGVFDCGSFLNSIITGIKEDNYVILDDRNYYEPNPRKIRSASSKQGLTTVELEMFSHWDRKYFDYVNTLSEANKKIRFFLLTPGDYRDYQDLALLHGGTDDEKKYILYYDGPTDASLQDIKYYFSNNLCTSDYHPDGKPDSEQAIIERILITSTGGNWVISGITVRGNHYSYDGNTGGIVNEITDSNNIIKSCIFENITGVEFVGHHFPATNSTPEIPKSHGTDFIVMQGVSNNIITDCIFREKNECVPAYHRLIEMAGIFIKGNSNIENNIIFDNDMKNLGDAIQIKSDFRYSSEGAPGTLIYGNEIYNDKFYEIDLPGGCVLEGMNGENAIDLKIGAGPWGCGTQPLPIDEKVIIANNNIYGWRAGIAGGGNGDAIEMHENAKNIAILDNHINDCARGISISGNIRVVGENECNISHVEHIEVYNNVICNLYPNYSDMVNNPCYAANSVKSIGITVGNESVVVADNIISNCTEGILMKHNGVQAVITRNYIDNIYRNTLIDNRGVEGDLDNFTENTFINFQTVCSGSENNYYPSSRVVDANYFLCPDGCRLTGNICPYDEETTCP